MGINLSELYFFFFLFYDTGAPLVASDFEASRWRGKLIYKKFKRFKLGKKKKRKNKNSNFQRQMKSAISKRRISLLIVMQEVARCRTESFHYSRLRNCFKILLPHLLPKRISNGKILLLHERKYAREDHFIKITPS